MVKLEQLAQTALNGDSLQLRSLTQDFCRENPNLFNISQPQTTDQEILAIAVSLLELLALRLKQQAPHWTQTISSLDHPIFLVKAAMTMKCLRTLCETESPELLRKRGFYAPPNFLEFA